MSFFIRVSGTLCRSSDCELKIKGLAAPITLLRKHKTLSASMASVINRRRLWTFRRITSTTASVGRPRAGPIKTPFPKEIVDYFGVKGCFSKKGQMRASVSTAYRTVPWAGAKSGTTQRTQCGKPIEDACLIVGPDGRVTEFAAWTRFLAIRVQMHFWHAQQFFNTREVACEIDHG